jgi:hypothetical protein
MNNGLPRGFPKLDDRARINTSQESWNKVHMSVKGQFGPDSVMDYSIRIMYTVRLHWALDWRYFPASRSVLV